jgi:energy-converting hydrogenase Eha subunit H
MSEILPLVLTISVASLTVVLVILAIKLIMVLSQIKHSLQKFNQVIDKANQVVDTTQNKIEGILNPFHSLSAFITNFTAGLKVTEGFMAWLNRHREDDSKKQDQSPLSKKKK